MFRAVKAVHRANKANKAQLKAAEFAGEAAAQSLQQRSEDLDARSLRDAFRAVKAVRKENKARKWGLKATEAAGKAAAEQVQSQPQERDFVADDDDLFTRDFDDELSARMFEQFRQKYREAKVSRLQHKLAKATAKAGGGDTGNSDVSARDLADELQELSERDLEEELEMRDVDDDLSARMFEQFRQKYREAKVSRLQNKLAKATAKAGGGDTGNSDMSSRDLVDELQELSERDLEEELEMRDANDDLYARMFEAFRQKYRDAKAARLQKDLAKATAKAGGSLPIQDAPGDVTSRDVDDGLDARSLGDMWRAWRAESPEKKALRLQRQAALAQGNAAAATVSQSLTSKPPLDVRDIFEELDDRDFEEIDELD